MKLRDLTRDEVAFTMEVEPELDVSPEDSREDPTRAERIRARMDRGEVEAWCCITVKATWEGFEAYASLGGVEIESDHPEAALEKHRDEMGLEDEALDALNGQLQQHASKLALLRSPSDTDRMRAVRILARIAEVWQHAVEHEGVDVEDESGGAEIDALAKIGDLLRQAKLL